MNRHEIEEEADDERFKRSKVALHPMLPHVITLTVGAVINGFLVAFVAGQAFQRIDENSDDIAAIQADASPAAAQAIGEIRIFDQSIDRRVTNLEAELRAQRQEMMAYLQRIDDALRNHVGKD